MHRTSGTSTACSTVRSEIGSCGINWITSATCSNTICGTGMSTVSGTVLHLWDFRGPLDLVHHWHLSLRLSCLDGWHLVSDHNCYVYDLFNVLDLWELHGLLHFLNHTHIRVK